MMTISRKSPRFDVQQLTGICCLLGHVQVIEYYMQKGIVKNLDAARSAGVVTDDIRNAL